MRRSAPPSPPPSPPHLGRHRRSCLPLPASSRHPPQLAQVHGGWPCRILAASDLTPPELPVPMDNSGALGSATAPLTWHDFLERMRHPSAAEFVKSIKRYADPIAHHDSRSLCYRSSSRHFTFDSPIEVLLQCCSCSWNCGHAFHYYYNMIIITHVWFISHVAY